MQAKLSRFEWAFNLLMLAAIAIVLIVQKPPSGENINFYTLLTINIFYGLILLYSHRLWLIPSYVAQKKYGAYAMRLGAMLLGIGILGTASYAALDASIGIMPAGAKWSFQLGIAIPLVFIAFNLLLGIPAAYIYWFIWARPKQMGKISEIGLHLFLGGVFWIYLFQRLPYWDIHQYPKPFYASLAYASLLWIGGMALFYANSMYLIPKYLSKQQSKRYWLALLGVLATTVILDGLLASQFYWFQVVISKRIIEPFVMSSLKIKLFLILPISFFYRFAKDWLNSLITQRQLAMAELNYLRNQIKPHFLFNTLNSLYSSAIVEESPQTAEGIAKLSSLMRYALHESPENRISLQKELDYLEDYISLQIMRLPTKTQGQVSFSSSGAIEGLTIAPMMLITFIENCFQHGIQAGMDTDISIEIKVNEEMLSLETRNPSFNTTQAGNGVGLSNTIKRLEIAYPKQHELQQFEEGNYFISKLSIQLT